MNSSRPFPGTPERFAEGMSRQARRFFVIAFLAIGSAILLGWTLGHFIGRTVSKEPILFPKAFLFSSILLLLGSIVLNQAIRSVKREKQRLFRLWLLLGLVIGILFIGIQSYGLWVMFPRERTADSASRGVSAFVMCLATLHGLHFLIAVLFVTFILARTWSDRYDHEYYWGVQVCAWFWHFLGIVWIAILMVIAIAL